MAHGQLLPKLSVVSTSLLGLIHPLPFMATTLVLECLVQPHANIYFGADLSLMSGEISGWGRMAYSLKEHM
jgi:hypothetical protein